MTSAIFIGGAISHGAVAAQTSLPPHSVGPASAGVDPEGLGLYGDLYGYCHPHC